MQFLKFKVSKPEASTREHEASASDVSISLTTAESDLQAALDAFDREPSEAHENAVQAAHAMIAKLQLHADRAERLRTQAADRERAAHEARIDAEAEAILASIATEALKPEVDKMHRTMADLARALAEVKLEQRALARKRNDRANHARSLLASIGKEISGNPNDPHFYYSNGNWPDHGFDAGVHLAAQEGDSIEMQRELNRLGQKLQGF